MSEVAAIEQEIDQEALREKAAAVANMYRGALSFTKGEVVEQLRRMSAKCIGLFAGNRAGKTASVAYHYFERWLGANPIEEKNVLMKKVRCMSSSLPEGNDIDMQDNAQYIELKKLIPYEMIEKDITSRSTNLVVRRRLGLSSPRTVFEFRSSKQEMQDLGKINLSSVWHDEETPEALRTECQMRLIQEGGDEIFTLTATNPFCFDEDTELLTKRGWKRFDEILITDEAYTYNITEDCMEWNNLQAYHVYQYSGPMYQMKNKSFDFLVTRNHKWVVCNDRRENNLFLKETSELNSRNRIKRISSNVILRKDDNPEYEDNFIAAVGWLVSDGTNNHDTAIYQSLTAYPTKCRQIDEILSMYGDNVRTYEHDYGNTIIDGKQWNGSGRIKRWTITRELRKRLRSVVTVKSPRQEFICSLSKRQLEILLKAIIDGDGYITESGGIRLNQRNNEELIDSVQLISSLLGRLSHKDRWVDCRGKVIDGVSIYSNSNRFWPNTHFKSLETKEVMYSGFIWCPTTKNGTIVVRRNGTVSISGNSYTYDKVFKRASYLFRTKTVSEYTGLPQQEWHKTGSKISCIFMSTWDNPTLQKEEIERMMSEMDPAEIPLRIYGVFTQVTGRVHKTYDPSICFIPFKKYFSSGIPYQWVHSRGIDYHESRIPWSVGWLSASPEDEWFLWQEFHPAIDGPNAYNTYEIVKSIARQSGDYYYQINLIDPLANKKQPNTLFSTTDDLNRHFDQLRMEEGLGTPCFWQGWDTKGTGGRDQVSTRFKNAVRCGRPFNNTTRDRGTIKRLPTLWICDTAPKFHRSLLDWSYGEYVTSSTKAVNDPKPVPQNKNSHDCMVLECLAKDSRLLFASHFINNPPRQMERRQVSVTGRA